MCNIHWRRFQSKNLLISRIEMEGGVGIGQGNVLNVTELVANEYNVDRSRIYLMGNSMGGRGTWYLSSKYPERWAGIAPCGAAMISTGYPFAKLKGMPGMMVMGELDNYHAARESARLLKEHGLDVVYEEVKGGTHGTAVEIAMPKIFEFFKAHGGSNSKQTSDRQILIDRGDKQCRPSVSIGHDHRIAALQLGLAQRNPRNRQAQVALNTTSMTGCSTSK